LPFVSILVTLTIVLGILIPTKFMSVPTTRVVEYEQHHDNAQMILISLLSSTTDDEKTIQELIGEYLIFGEPDDLDLLIKEKLEKLVSSKCYSLSTPSKKLLIESIDCVPKEYKKDTYISLPYNLEGITEKLILVID